MTVASTPRRAGPYAGNGANTSFTFSFKVSSKTDIAVYRVSAGVQSTLVLDSDYSVTLNTNQTTTPGGTVTYPISGSALASGETLTIAGAVPYDQQTQLPSGGAYNAANVEEALDRRVMQTQQVVEIANRAVQLPVSAPSGTSPVLPLPEANSVIAWNANGTALQNVTQQTLATAVTYGTANADLFSGNGSTVNFVLSANPGALNNLDVSISGVAQRPGVDYLWSSGTTITFTTAPPAGTNNVLVRYMRALAQGTMDSAGTSFIQAGTGAVTRTARDKMRESVSVKDFGATTTPTQRTAALLLALSEHDTVFVNSGVYDHVDISMSDKILNMDGDVEFKLPDLTVNASSVTGPAVVKISGDRVTINGNFTINGNRANNDSSGFPTSVHVGGLYVTGEDFKCFGEVKIINSYFHGFSAEGGTTSGSELEKLYIQRLFIQDSTYHSVLMWSVSNWRIDEIYATGGTPGAGRDQRIRFGTQNAETSECLRGSVGTIYSDALVTLVVDSRSRNISIGTALCGAGGKIEDASIITVDSWIAWDASYQNSAYGFLIDNCSNVNIGTVLVKDYDCNPAFTGYAFVINGVAQCHIGSVVVRGSLTSVAGSYDAIIRSADGLHIGQMALLAPVGTIRGFLYDYDAAYAPQRDITIDSLISRGHNTYDVTIENKSAIKIGALNSDAVEEFPNNRNNMAVVRQSTWTPTISRSGSAVSYTKQSGVYAVVGQMVIATIDVVINTITTQGSGYWLINLPIAAKQSYAAQSGNLLFNAAASTTVGVYALSGSSNAYLINSSRNDAYNGSLSSGTISFTICYMID